ncbi:hypothetical protein PUN28_007928 [Cardiocondyla obscurior]|uniref:Uncharacterized protein n=1 Tax=Cardiocondyla obscurior TaxID=286306 RepID=A0AAW2FV07_9HYME
MELRTSRDCDSKGNLENSVTELRHGEKLILNARFFIFLRRTRELRPRLFSAHVTHTHTRQAKFFGRSSRRVPLHILPRRKFGVRSARDTQAFCWTNLSCIADQ